MGKTKKNRKGMAEQVARKKTTVTKLNPFDVRMVRPKQKILGRKMKTDVGKPGIARAKSIAVRKETLLQEYKMKNKSNMFLDKRIGEKDSNLSAEDKMIARYTAERLHGSGRESIFNLGDKDDLTHGGTSLDNIGKFDNPNSDGEEDADEERLNSQFVAEAHFGGFMTKKDDDFKEGKGNTRKDFIDNLIKESKKRKAEKQKLNEETEEKTNSLDTDWKSLLRTVQGSSIMHTKEEDMAIWHEEMGCTDPFDMLVRQLTYDRKEARGSTRLKTDDELLKEEKEKLEKLEADRLRRMRGEREEPKHTGISVEDMGDDEVKKKNKMSKKEQRRLMKQLLGDKEEGDEESGEEEEEEGGEEGDEEEEEDESDDEEGEEEDKYSDVDESEEEEEKEMDQNEKDRYDAETVAMIEKASSELPYSFTVPATIEDLTNIVAGRSVDEVKLILERIMKCNHPSLAEGNKDALMVFYSILLQYVNECACSFDEEGTGEYNLERIGLQIIEAVTPTLFTLTGMFQAHAAKSLQEVLKEKYDAFSQQTRKSIPGLDTIVFLKLVLLLFPASDYRHPVISPALIFISSIFSKARPKDRPSFAASLALAAILTDAIKLSKRYSPELIGFVCGIFHCASTSTKQRPVPPCKGGSLLSITAPVKGEPEKLKLSAVTSVKDMDDKFKASCLYTTCRLTLTLLDLYRDLPSAGEIFQPISVLIGDVTTDNLSKAMKKQLKEVATKIRELPAKAGAIVRPAKPTKMLRMLEPEIEEGFRLGEKKRKGDKTMLEEQKLKYKIRQERKGARKEIRKDVAFLANQKFRERREKDEDRKARTKNLLSHLANQEGEHQTIQRKSGKKKF